MRFFIYATLFISAAIADNVSRSVGSNACDFDEMYSRASQFSSKDTQSIVMDEYMRSCGETVLSVNKSEIAKVLATAAPVRTSNVGCIPDSSSLPYLFFRGKITLKDSINTNIFLDGAYQVQVDSSDNCIAHLTLVSFTVSRIVMSNKFTKLCIEIKDVNFNGCAGCGYTVTRSIESESLTSTTTRPPVQPCAGAADILQLLQISNATSNQNLNYGLKPASTRFLEAFNLNSNDAFSGLFKFRNITEEVIELGSDIGQNFVASKATIQMIPNAGGSSKIEIALQKAYEKFVAVGRSNVPHILMVYATSLPTNMLDYNTAIDNLFTLENYIPLVIAFNSVTNTANVDQLMKIAGCEPNQICQNFVVVATNDNSAIIDAAEYLSKLACTVISKKISLKPNIYPALKMKISDMKVADIEKISGVNDFLTNVKSQAATQLGTKASSLVAYKIEPASQVLDDQTFPGFLTSKIDGITALKNALKINQDTSTRSKNEATNVEFLIVDEYEKFEQMFRGATVPQTGKMDKFLNEHLTFTGINYRAGPNVVNAIREEKLGFKPLNSYRDMLESLGKQAVAHESEDEARKRYDLLNLLKERALLEKYLSTKEGKSTPSRGAVNDVYENVNCVIKAGYHGVVDIIGKCGSPARSSGIVDNNVKIQGAINNIKSIVSDKDQMEYMRSKTDAISYLVNMKGGHIKSSTDENSGIKSKVAALIPDITLLTDILH